MTCRTSSIDLARRLRKRYPDLVIVFVTAYIEYAPAGYHVEAFRYLLKSRLQTELPPCLDAVWDELFESQDSIQIQLADRTTMRLRIRDILYLEGTPYRHILLHTTTTPNALECIGKLTDYEQHMASKGFIRIQKSYLVNMFYITDIRNYNAFLRNGQSLRVSQKFYADIQRHYVLWKGQQL